MKNILIINLKGIEDIYQSAHFIRSLHKKHSNSNISYLIFDECEESIRCIKNIKNIYTIPRDKIATFFNNAIYNIGFAINELDYALRPTLSAKWDNIINYSNNKLSTYLTSYLTHANATPFSGIKFNQIHSVVYSDQWAQAYNDVLTSFFPSPMTIVDVLNTQNDLDDSSEEIINVQASHDKKVAHNFKMVKKMNNDSKIVGIRMLGSKKASNLSLSTVIDVFKLLIDYKKTTPILLIRPNDYERNLANEVNKNMNSKILSIESDFVALPSIIKNLDLLISPESPEKHLADLLDVSCLELSLDPISLFQKRTVNPKSYVLSYRIDQNSFSDNPDINQFRNLRGIQIDLKPKDIFKCSQIALGYADTEEAFDSFTQCSLYTPIKDSLGTFFVNKSGFINPHLEMKHLMGRFILSDILDFGKIQEITRHIVKTFDKKTIISWVEEENNGFSLAIKDLLATIRSLIKVQESMKNGDIFVQSLDNLLNHSQKKRPFGHIYSYF